MAYQGASKYIKRYHQNIDPIIYDLAYLPQYVPYYYTCDPIHNPYCISSKVDPIILPPKDQSDIFKIEAFTDQIDYKYFWTSIVILMIICLYFFIIR